MYQSLAFEKLLIPITMLNTIYIAAFPLVILLSPILPLHISLEQLSNTTFPFYFTFFFGFYFLGLITSFKPESDDNTKFQNFLWYFTILASTAAIIVSLHHLRFNAARPTTFIMILVAATLIGAKRSLGSKGIFILSCTLTFACYFVTLMAGFESLNFPFYYATIPYCVAISLIGTGHFVASSITTRTNVDDASAFSPRTRKQRRKRKALERSFASTRPTRLTAGMLLLGGPLVIIACSSIGIFESKYLLLSLALIPLRPLLSNLLPATETIDFSDNFLRDYTSFCYLFLAMILLLKLTPI